MSDIPDYSDGGPTRRRSFRERLIGALTIDATVYEEVEHTPDAIKQAAWVVAIAALARGIGGYEAGFVAGVLGAFVMWVVGTGIIWLIGVVILDHTSDFPELLRTLGFASAPQVLYIAGILPLGPLEGMLTLGVWLLGVFAWVVAVRQALDVSTGRAVVICALGGLPSLLWALVFGAVLFVAAV